MEVDPELWCLPQNSESYRIQSTEKNSAINKQIDDMLELGIIEYSDAPYYSQVILTPKPSVNGQKRWRMVIDYRNLNDATALVGWKIPNIKELLLRVGAKKAKYFGVLDLTQGYFQILCAEQCRKWTAFICFRGIFQFTRCPMGIKNAPAIFQRLIATVVLVGL
jgi:hypothetical protein